MPKYSLHTLFASGGIYSTAEDLYKWDKALYGNQLLSKVSKEILFSPVLFDYACGWYVKKGNDEEGNYLIDIQPFLDDDGKPILVEEEKSKKKTTRKKAETSAS